MPSREKEKAQPVRKRSGWSPSQPHGQRSLSRTTGGMPARKFCMNRAPLAVVVTALTARSSRGIPYCRKEERTGLLYRNRRQNCRCQTDPRSKGPGSGLGIQGSLTARTINPRGQFPAPRSASASRPAQPAPRRVAQGFALARLQSVADRRLGGTAAPSFAGDFTVVQRMQFLARLEAHCLSRGYVNYSLSKDFKIYSTRCSAYFN